MIIFTLLSFIPAKCWIAPEMATAMYSSGATILPVCPTCMSFGTYPASTAARDAPTEIMEKKILHNKYLLSKEQSSEKFSDFIFFLW